MPSLEVLRQALFWTAVLAIAAAQGALLVLAFRASRSPGAAEVRVRSSRRQELAMALMPAALAALLIFLAWRTMFATSP